MAASKKRASEIVAARMMHLSKEQAQGFYDVHRERPFFNDLVDYMTSGPVVVQALQGDDAIAKNREIMGATNPADADPGTIRADFAASIEENVVHGSDGPDTAATRNRLLLRRRGRLSAHALTGKIDGRRRRKKKPAGHAARRARAALRTAGRETVPGHAS